MKHRYLKISPALLAVTFLCIGALPTAMQAVAQEGPTDQEKAIHYSLYYEDFKNGNYEGALPNLRWILAHSPEFQGRRKTDKNFERAIKAYEEIGMAQEDDEIRRAYLDSALVMFDVAVPTLQDKGVEIDVFEWTRNKGTFILKHQDDLEDHVGEIAGLFRKIFELDPARTQLFYLEYVIRDCIANEDKQCAIDFMTEIERKAGDNAEIMARINEFRGALFTSPEERIAFLEQKLEKTPDDLDIITELFELYEQEKYRDKMYEMGARLQQMKPDPRIYRILAKMRLDDGDADEAIKMYEQSLAMPGGKDAAREVYYNIGIAHQQEGRLSKARVAFRKALQIDPSYGMALIGIGDLYVSSVANCGSFEREDRTVYWLATDYFERARDQDPSVSRMANQRIRSIRRSFPDQEALFFKGWNPGDSFTIDGSLGSCYAWIGETTRVRHP